MVHNQTSWLMTALVVAAVATAGWYVGSRAGHPEAATQDRTASNAGIYRHIGARVLDIDTETRTIKLDHERIEGFMDAMTMDLKAADSADLAAVEVGQRVRFDLARVDGSYKVVAIQPDTQSSSSPTAQRATPEEPVDPLERGDIVPDLALYDTKGERFGLHEMKPERKLITFFYVRCPIETYCPTQSRRLADLQQQLAKAGSDVHLVSLTLDGGHDGPAVLADYAERFGADPARWTLAGGEDAAAVRRFANRAGARVRAEQEGYQIDHALVGLRVEGNRIIDRVFGIESIVKMAEGM